MRTRVLCLTFLALLGLPPGQPLSAQATQPFAGCGVLVMGVEANCFLLVADAGGAYLIGLNGFQLGNHVYVEGVIDPFCITTCQQGNGCMFTVTTMTLCTAPVVEFRRGNCNDDAGLDISDAIFLLGLLFPGPVPTGPANCDDACDANDDGQLNVADAIALLGSIFGNPAVPLPAPGANCGPDPTTADSLDCLLTSCP